MKGKLTGNGKLSDSTYFHIIKFVRLRFMSVMWFTYQKYTIIPVGLSTKDVDPMLAQC